MKSWKTTLGGWFAGAGLVMSGVADPQWVHFLGLALAGLGAAFLGFNAKDSNVTGAGDTAVSK